MQNETLFAQQTLNDTFSGIDEAEKLYQTHASAETVPQGSLATDLAPKQLLRALKIMLAKKSLPAKRLPIRLDLKPFLAPDFQYDTSSTMAVANRLKSVPMTHGGMKLLCQYNGELCVQFYGVRFVNINFDHFVNAVDISRVGDSFRDVLGINTKILRTDSQGRPTLQIERIAALAQPNYSAFLGKDELDVYKLEYQQYSPDMVINWMRTVCSPNASTVADDSYLSFSRLASNGTKIEFVALQQFPLPRIMVLLGLSRWRWLREFLTLNAYRNFWHDTTNNILSVYEKNRHLTDLNTAQDERAHSEG